MQSTAATIKEYINEAPEDRQSALEQLQKVLSRNLPKGFKEAMGYGMPGFVVPHSLYPAGYHCSPELPLPFVSFASQKNFIAVYHMGLYADPQLLKWFVDEYASRVKRNWIWVKVASGSRSQSKYRLTSWGSCAPR